MIEDGNRIRPDPTAMAKGMGWARACAAVARTVVNARWRGGAASFWLEGSGGR